MICPRCGRQNPGDALFCNRCGLRLRSEGVTYRNRHAGDSGGSGQVLLTASIIALALLVLGGGGVMLLLSAPGATPTQIAAATPTAPPTLPPFVQPTASPSPSPSPSASPSPSPSASPSPSPTLVPTAVPTLPPTPKPTAEPTPEPTPLNCDAATGTPTHTLFLGVGNATERGPTARAWCVDVVTTRIVFGSTFGTVRLLRNNRVLVEVNCEPPLCQAEYVRTFGNPRLVKPGQVLRYEFMCTGDGVPENGDECADANPDGATIEIGYERVKVP